MFVVGGLYSELNGVTRITCDLANALTRQRAAVTVYTALCKDGRPADHLLRPPARCEWTRGRWLGALSWSPELKQIIERDIAAANLVHSHSVWMLPNHYASRAARRHGKPVVFTAHGVFEDWAIRRSRWKKRLVGRWFQDRDLREASCIHVNTGREVGGVRAYGLNNPIAIIPNGVDLAAFANVPSATAFGARRSHLAGKKIVLFLSRLHQKKGLAHLIEAWRRVAADHNGWHLVLAGPDDGFEAEARRRVEDAGLVQAVTFVGALQGYEKLEAFAAADVFALPSFSEGFSMAILEAMACSLPVLITPGCNFDEAERAGAGVIVQPDAAGTEQGLRRLLEMADSQRTEMGRRGRALVEQSYTWDAVATQMLSLYRWLLGGGPQPEFVHS